MKYYYRSLCGIILLVLFVFLLLLLACSFLIGMGYLINRIYHIDLFQSILIVSIAGIALILIWIKFSVENIEHNLNETDDWYDEDDEDIEDDDDIICPECGEKLVKSEIRIPEHKNSKNTAGVGRNAPCPCGSGKKYKKCCGK